MKNTQRKLKLKSDIQKVIDAINNQVDSYISTFSAKNKGQRILAKDIFEITDKKLKDISTYMSKKYDR